MKLSITTLGCKLNQAESEEIKNELKIMGHVFVTFSSPADIAIVRACAVTSGASQTARELIRRANRRGSFVIASGCLENHDLPEIDYVAQTAGDIVRKVRELTVGISPVTHETIEELKDRTRAMIKIQNGCNFNCAYCTIPAYRGKAVSEAPGEIIAKIMDAEKNGINEVTLTGVNICQYRFETMGLAELIKQILDLTQIRRIRLGSLDPRLVNPNLMAVFKNPRLMPHWHLSLQSGSDSVLKRMKRGYTTRQYLSIVQTMRRRNPLFSFTTDIIVGFPGETDKEFRETMNYVKKIGFSKVHVFPYSKRPDTLASEMPDQVNDKIKNERVGKLINFAEKVGKKYRAKLQGKTRAALFESRENGFWIGFAPEYVQVKYKSAKNLKNTIVEIKINPA
jgi:threonylcarbamoyladenosine tRNA methylthiotransferase MtaB